MRFSQAHVDEWREEGFCIIDNFFTSEEIAPVLADYEQLYADAAAAASGKARVVDPAADNYLANRRSQFNNLDNLPYHGGIEMNLISLHPQLIAFARALLGVEDIVCYQSHTWAKFTGAADYDQDFHCDFGNHTLTVPADDVADRCVDFIFYLTDVTPAHGALRYVTKPDVERVLGRRALAAPTPEQQAELRTVERAATVHAGGLVAHSIDTMHRGANLTVPGGRRFSMTVGYKAAGNDNIQHHVWQTGADRPWENVLNHASPEQLSMLGIPAPGDPYWSLRTLKLTQARWPGWDMSPYFRAAGYSEPSNASASAR